jgi:hypothetical protein
MSIRIDLADDDTVGHPERRQKPDLRRLRVLRRVARVGRADPETRDDGRNSPAAVYYRA